MTLRFYAGRASEVFRHVDANGEYSLGITNPEIIIIPEGCTINVETSVRLEIPANYALIIVQSQPTAGVLVAPGLIDSGYRGQVGITVTNLLNDDYVFQPFELCVSLEPLSVEVDARNRLHASAHAHCPDGEEGAVRHVTLPHDHCCVSGTGTLKIHAMPPRADERLVVYRVPGAVVGGPLFTADPEPCLQMADAPVRLVSFGPCVDEYFFCVERLPCDTIADTFVAPYPLMSRCEHRYNRSAVTFSRNVSGILAPKRHEDAGYDVIAQRPLDVGPGETRCLRIPLQHRSYHCQVYALVLGRSSLNARGVLARPAIWPELRDLTLTIRNASGQPFRAEPGHRVAQVVFGVGQTCCGRARLPTERGRDEHQARYLHRVLRGLSPRLQLEQAETAADFARSGRMEGKFGSTGQ